MTWTRREALGALGLGLLTGAGGTRALAASRKADEVVVYAALDREFSEPILKEYGRTSGVNVRPKFDVESTKTVGLTNQIIAEASRPRCDVFWNNEVLNTLRLKEKGLLAPFRPSHAGDVPEPFRDPEGLWHGFAARARVLIVNTDLVPETKRPKSIRDLHVPEWKGKAGLAKPLFGTTATHAACLFAAFGDAEARAYFQAIKANDVQILAGNKQVATSVASGQLAFGMTDTDDAMIELENGAPVAIVYPDREPGEVGTLYIPNTLAIIKGGPNQEAARALVDSIFSPAVEAQLAKGPSAQVPLIRGGSGTPRVETPETVHAMEVDFGKAAALWDKVAAFLAAEFAAAG